MVKKGINMVNPETISIDLFSITLFNFPLHFKLINKYDNVPIEQDIKPIHRNILIVWIIAELMDDINIINALIITYFL